MARDERYAPWPLFIRVALPFTYYLFYHSTAVIARSYALLPVLTFGCAILCLNAARRPGLFTLIACMLAAVSLDGFVLAAVIYGDSLRHTRRVWAAHNSYERKRILGAAGTFLIGSGTYRMVRLWPARDNQFVTHLNVSGLTPTEVQSCDDSVCVHRRMGHHDRRHRAISDISSARWDFAALFGCNRRLVRGSFTDLHACMALGGLLLAWLFCMWTAAARISITAFAATCIALVICVSRLLGASNRSGMTGPIRIPAAARWRRGFYEIILISQRR